MGKYDFSRDAEKESGYESASNKETAQAHHDAKDDAQRSGELNERLESKVQEAHENLVHDAFTGGNQRS